MHYAHRRQACYRDELAAMPGVRVLHGYTRSGSRRSRRPLRRRTTWRGHAEPDAVFVCGPTALVEAVREHCENVYTESFVPPHSTAANPSGGRVTFADSGIDAVDDGRSLLEQAESAG